MSKLSLQINKTYLALKGTLSINIKFFFFKATTLKKLNFTIEKLRNQRKNS